VSDEEILNRGGRNVVRSVFGVSLVALSIAIAAIYALIGSGGILVFGFGKSLLDFYFLIYPFLFLLILLMAFISLRLLAVLLLANFVTDWAVRVVVDWPRSEINPIQSYGDIMALSIVLMGIVAYFSFPKELRNLGVVGAVRDS
jgi:hypothetical protein